MYLRIMENINIDLIYMSVNQKCHNVYFCVNLFIDLQNELKLAQILSLQPVYLHCYIFHPLYVNGGVLYFI